jgi:GntR family transcriptional repressor for pyruvate dehydrogenase complex
LIEARKAIEVELAYFASSRGTQKEKQAIAAAIDDMKKAESHTHFVQADIGFHLAIAKASHSTVLENFVNVVQGLLSVWVMKVVSKPEHVTVKCLTIKEHDLVLTAIEAAQPEEARSAMLQHIESASARLRETLEVKTCIVEGEIATGEGEGR